MFNRKQSMHWSHWNAWESTSSLHTRKYLNDCVIVGSILSIQIVTICMLAMDEIHRLVVIRCYVCLTTRGMVEFRDLRTHDILTHYGLTAVYIGRVSQRLDAFVRWILPFDDKTAICHRRRRANGSPRLNTPSHFYAQTMTSWYPLVLTLVRNK